MKNALFALAICVFSLYPSANPQTSSAAQPTQAAPLQSVLSTQQPATAPSTPTLEDGTPIKLRISETVSSAEAQVGQTVAFEVLEEVKVANIVIIPKGGTAWATVTEAQHKRRMGRGGKLDMNIDTVRLADGEKIALRAVKAGSGGGHVGAMTGAIVATSIIFFPAAPLFLFMHGKDITIPKGTEIAAFVNGNVPLEMAKFQPATPQPVAVPEMISAETLAISSTPDGAEIELDGSLVGNSPSSIGVAAGDHTLKIFKSGYQTWERKIKASSGNVKIEADLQPADIKQADPKLVDAKSNGATTPK